MNAPMTSLVKTALGVALLGATSTLGIRWLTQIRIRSSEMYKEAIECMRNNANVKDILGEPIKEKSVDVGKWKHYGHDDNKMWVVVPVKGSKRSGNLHYVVTAHGNTERRQLKLANVEFEVKGSQTRVVLKKDPSYVPSPLV